MTQHSFKRLLVDLLLLKNAFDDALLEEYVEDQAQVKASPSVPRHDRSVNMTFQPAHCT